MRSAMSPRSLPPPASSARAVSASLTMVGEHVVDNPAIDQQLSRGSEDDFSASVSLFEDAMEASGAVNSLGRAAGLGTIDRGRRKRGARLPDNLSRPEKRRITNRRSARFRRDQKKEWAGIICDKFLSMREENERLFQERAKLVEDNRGLRQHRVIMQEDINALRQQVRILSGGLARSSSQGWTPGHRGEWPAELPPRDGPGHGGHGGHGGLGEAEVSLPTAHPDHGLGRYGSGEIFFNHHLWPEASPDPELFRPRPAEQPCLGQLQPLTLPPLRAHPRELPQSCAMDCLLEGGATPTGRCAPDTLDPFRLTPARWTFVGSKAS